MTICSETTQLKDTVLHLLAENGAVDNSNYGNDGSFQGGMGTAEGTQGLEYVFDGVDDYILTTTGAITGTNPAMTLSVWMYQTSRPSGDFSALIEITKGGSGEACVLEMGEDSGITYVFTDSVNPSNNIAVTGSEIPALNQWHHLAMVIDGAKGWTYYLNGVATKTGTFTADIVLNGTNIQVGAKKDFESFNGSLKDIRVISRAITVTEIRELYNAVNRPTLDNEVLKLQPATGLVDQSAAGQANSSYNGDAGVVGRDYRFDGTGDTITTPSIALSGDRSVSFWVYWTTTINDVVIGGATVNDYYPYIDGSARVWLNDSGTATKWTSTGISNQNEWYHVAITGDGTTATLYVNGVSKGTITDASPTITTIAGWGGGSTFQLGGRMRDVRIASSVWSEAEVLQLYEGVPGWEPSPAPRQLPGTVLHLEAATGERDQSYYQQACTFSGSNIADDSSDDAFVFNGTDDFIDCGASTDFDITTGISLSLWFYASGAGEQGYLISKTADGTNGNYWLYYNGATNAIQFKGGGASYSDTVFGEGEWHHVALTCDDSTARWYKNGVAINSYAETISNTVDSTPVTIGNRTNGASTGTHFNGMIRDIRILNTALSADSVALLYNRGCANYRPPGLLGGEQLALMMSRHDVGVLDGTVLQLDGSTEYADQSGLGNDATNSGTTISDGKFVFDGASVITVDVAPALPATIAFRFKKTQTAFEILFEGDGTTTAQAYLYTDGKIYAGVNGYSATQISTATTVDAWHHAVLVLTSTTDRDLYLDGALIGNNTVSQTSTGEVATIGARAGTSWEFTGEMDDFRVFNRALSAAEITVLYNNVIQDSSANGNHGVMTNGAYVGEDDEIIVDGTSYAESSASIDGMANLTLSMWFKTRVAGAAVPVRLMGKLDSTDVSYYISMTSSSGNIVFAVENSSGTGESARSEGSVDLADQQWHHVGGVYDGAELLLYIDGVISQQGYGDALTGTVNASAAPTRFGGPYAFFYGFDGSIRDARIFDRALSAAEILTLASEYEFQVPNTRGSVLGIVPSYFDTEADVTAIDWSGNGNAGVMTNGPTYTADVDEGGTRAIEFDGSDDHTEHPTFEYANTDTFSLSQWFYPHARTGSPAYLSNLKGGGAGHGIEMQWRNTFNFYVGIGGSWSLVSASATGLTLNEWHIVTGVYDGTNITLYFNGDLVGTTAATGAITAANNSFTIGRGSGSFDGLIDDVYYWKRALNLDEIKALASTRNYFNCPDTVAGSAGLIMRQLYGGGQL